MNEPRIRAATAADVPAIADVVDQAYRHYIARIGKPPGPMLDDFVFADRAADPLEDFDRLAIGMQGLAWVAPEGLGSPDRLDLVHFFGFGDRREANNGGAVRAWLPCLYLDLVGYSIVPGRADGTGGLSRAIKSINSARSPRSRDRCLFE